jgi:superoxide dismutase, Fe-Mn family
MFGSEYRVISPLTLTFSVRRHAYYLQYKNVRPDYLNQIWNVVNFSNVAERLEAAKRA